MKLDNIKFERRTLGYGGLIKLLQLIIRNTNWNCYIPVDTRNYGVSYMFVENEVGNIMYVQQADPGSGLDYSTLTKPKKYEGSGQSTYSNSTPSLDAVGNSMRASYSSFKEYAEKQKKFNSKYMVYDRKKSEFVDFNIEDKIN